MSLKNNYKIIALLVGTIFSGMVACDRSPIQSSKTDGQGIVSNRPQNEDRIILMVRLKTPALVTQLKEAGKSRVIDTKLENQLIAEQTEFINSVKELSSKVVVIQQFRKIINAVALVVPVEIQSQVQKLAGNNAHIERSQGFSRPSTLSNSVPQMLARLQDTDLNQATPNSLKSTSVEFIGALKAHALGFTGKGIKVGIIDTGIDYTHKMLGGTGNKQEFLDTNPSLPSQLFPNSKVVGGFDFVGTEYDSASYVFANRIPMPDVNPIDEGGHGSHVGGTVAGIGDLVTSYSGVAPDAELYALKVFGKDGSTGDEVVIAALEYALDPNMDGDLSDQLDIVNMSLGSSYGTAHLLYTEAIKNLSDAGTMVVASAGNSGHKDFIVGSPSVSDEAISVAASVDNMEHNWQFPAVQFVSSGGETFVAEAVEGPISKPISEAGDVSGDLVYIGFANTDMPQELKDKLKGKVALIDRGLVAFTEKIQRAQEAGAIGAVVANNSDGAPFAMGGVGSYEIPAIMISKSYGMKIKSLLLSGSVLINFKTSLTINKPELIDTLTDFSSRGPRSLDAKFKPDISAPGQSIVSAEMGGGTKPVKMSGTSMAAPHMAGVMALIKNAHPGLSSIEYKSIAMGTSKLISDANKNLYPLSQQGAGRIQVEKAVTSVLASETPSISLGHVNIEKFKTIQANYKLHNISKDTLNLKMKWIGSSAIKVNESNISMESGENFVDYVRFTIDASKINSAHMEVSGSLSFVDQNNAEVFRIPMLAYVHKISKIEASSALHVHSSSASDSENSLATLQVKNIGDHSGEILLFNLLGTDARKPYVPFSFAKGHSCDLQAVGYRVQDQQMDIAIKLYDSITRWELCDVSILIDTDGDETPELEIAGNPMSRLEGLIGDEFTSLLLDATKARKIRKDFENTVDPSKPIPAGIKPDFSSALIDQQDMKVFHNSSIAVLSVDISKLKYRPDGHLALRVLTTAGEERNSEGDDFLGDNTKWMQLDLTPGSISYFNLPTDSSLAPGATLNFSFTKGIENKNLMLLMPLNRGVRESLQTDDQMKILNPEFLVP